jgi:hypothetical protein
VALKYGPVASNSLDILNNTKDYLSNFSEKEMKFLNDSPCPEGRGESFARKLRTFGPIVLPGLNPAIFCQFKDSP